MINTRKRVLIFSLAYLPLAGGAELAIKNITDRIGDISFDLIALQFDSALPRREKIGNVTVHRIGFTFVQYRLEYRPIQGLRDRGPIKHIFYTV